MLDVQQLINLYTVFYQAMLDLGSVLTMSFRDAIVKLNETMPSIASVILGFISQSSNWEIWDYSLAVLIIGFSGVAFIGITMVKWLVDIIN